MFTACCFSRQNAGNDADVCMTGEWKNTSLGSIYAMEFYPDNADELRNAALSGEELHRLQSKHESKQR